MKTILIIEDNDEVRENMAEILSLSNYKVITAVNGKLGVETALAQLPDLIVCDIMMPVLDGYGVMHLLGKHAETATIPFIFLTAKADKANLRKGMEMGADDYLTKPFDGIDLLNAVEIRLKKSAALQNKKTTALPAVTHLFQDAGQNSLHLLMKEENSVYQYQKKHTVYKEGQKPKAVYYINSGKIKIFKTNDDGKELIINVATTGNFFGYMPVLQEMNYKDNAVVLEDAEVMLIPVDDFKQLISADAQVSAQFIKLITHDASGKEEDLLNLAYNSLRKKVAYGLMRMSDKYKAANASQSIITLSRENMAQAIGVATESLIRTLAEFKAEKLIELQPGKVIITNEEKLRHLPY